MRFLGDLSKVSERKRAVRKLLSLVLVIGLEPIRIISPRDFKSLVSAYSTTPANKTGNIIELCYPLVTRTRIELVLPPWKGGVLTAWPPGHMVAEIGLEPTTLRVWTECSSQLSYSAIYAAVEVR